MRSSVAIAITGLVLASCGGSWASQVSQGGGMCPGASPPTASGFGSGPVYLTGQSSWYAGGQAAILAVDPGYPGPLSVQAYPLGGDSRLKITMVAESLGPAAAAGFAEKELQHGRQLVSAQVDASGLALPAVTPSGLTREWLGRLSTTGAGCFAINAKGTTFSEVIVVPVNEGPAPPG